MAIAKVIITIRTQIIPSNPAEEDMLVAQGRPTKPIGETTEYLASGFMNEEPAKVAVQLSKDVLEKIFHDAEFVQG